MNYVPHPILAVSILVLSACPKTDIDVGVIAADASAVVDTQASGGSGGAGGTDAAGRDGSGGIQATGGAAIDVGGLGGVPASGGVPANTTNGQGGIPGTSSNSGGQVTCDELTSGGSPERGLKLRAMPSSTTGGSPAAATVADFDGDGKLDLAVANEYSQSVSVLLGYGDGTFAPKVDYPTGFRPIGIAAGDLNDDGKLDLATANGGADTVSVLLGNGDGTFVPTEDQEGGVYTSSIAIFDVNRDGTNDLVAGNVEGSTVSVLLGDGHGAFAPKVDYSAGRYPCDILVGDFNRDGKLDVATGNIGANNVTVLLGQGNGPYGSLGMKADFPIPYDGTYAAAIGDLNADGKLDMVTHSADSQPSESSTHVVVMRGAGDGSFAMSFDYTLLGTSELRPLVLGDMDGDGKLDVVVAADSALRIMFGAGDGTFACPQQQHPIPIGTYYGRKPITLADLNGDGRLDVIVTNHDTGSATALLNEPL